MDSSFQLLSKLFHIPKLLNYILRFSLRSSGLTFLFQQALSSNNHVLVSTMCSHVVPPRTQSPTLTSYNYQPVEDFNRVGGDEG